MSESFNLKVKVSGANHVTYDLITRLSEVVDAEEYDDLRFILASACDISIKHYGGDSFVAKNYSITDSSLF